MKLSIASGVSRVCPRAASSASRILLRIADSRSGAGSEPRVPQKRTRSGAFGSGLPSSRRSAGLGGDGMSQAAHASSIVAKIGTRCVNRLIEKISCTTSVRRATAIRFLWTSAEERSSKRAVHSSKYSRHRKSR
jgi:hypothetical protein